jgi:ubiquinone/menaquinone biosynthesis C-methylase UbiE
MSDLPVPPDAGTPSRPPHAFHPHHLRAMEEARRHLTPPEEVLGELSLDPQGVLVDVGAGTGFLAVPAARYLAQGKVVAVDHQEDMVQALRQRAQEEGLANLEAHAASAERLPLPDGSADAVTFSMVLHDLASPHRALAEAWRVLRPGGRVAVVEWEPGERDFGPPSHLLWEPSELVRRLQESGFRLVTLTRRPPAYVAVAAKDGKEGGAGDRPSPTAP